MSDDNSQAPVEPIIPQEEVAETATQEVSTQEQSQTEQPLTRDELFTLLQESQRQTMSMIQSQVAKGENRINQRITERIAALEANKGVLKLSDEQVSQAKREIINEEQMIAYAPQSPQASGQEQAPSNESVNREQVQFVYDQIGATFAEAGVDVTPNDVEWKTVESALNDPKGSLAKTIVAANQAATTKAARIKAQKEKASTRVVGTGGGSTGGAKPATSAHDAWGSAYEK